jgi:hypothetical protein
MQCPANSAITMMLSYQWRSFKENLGRTKLNQSIKTYNYKLYISAGSLALVNTQYLLSEDHTYI